MARSNEEWLRALAGHNAETVGAQSELRRLIVAGLSRVLARRGVGVDQCEDFAQEALLKIVAKLDTFRGESRFESWALAIATRVAFDELRHHRWRDVSLDAITADARAPLQFEPRQESTQERALIREQVVTALRRVIENELTDKQRGVLLAELSGLPQEEIARQLGMNRNAIYKLSHDARRKVKLELTTAGTVAADVMWAFE